MVDGNYTIEVVKADSEGVEVVLWTPSHLNTMFGKSAARDIAGGAVELPIQEALSEQHRAATIKAIDREITGMAQRRFSYPLPGELSWCLMLSQVY